MEKIVTTCALDCWDACSIEASVEDGRIVSLDGNAAHPITKGFLCGKTKRFAERVYDPERVLHPMRRRGEAWERISWERALDEIAGEMDRLRRGPGSQTIFHLQSAGSMGLLKKLSGRFFNLLGGVTEAAGDICLGAGERAMQEIYGEQATHAFEDLPNSRTAILWGRNPYGANIHLVPFLKEAKRRGAEIVLVDPVSIGGSETIDRQLRPRPGSDFLVILFLLRYGIEKDLLAREFLRERTVGAERFLEKVRRSDLGGVERKTGLARQSLEGLARRYWTEKPSSIWMGSGLQHHANGLDTVRLLVALGAASGNLGVPGGGVSFYQRHRKHFRTDFLAPNPKARPREVPAGRFHAILPRLEPAIEMGWVNGANPVAAHPGSAAVREAILRLRTLVVVDTHLTDTARCATHFLPTTTFLEEDGIVSSWGQNYVGRQRRAIAPLGEARTDLRIFQDLAARLGFGEEMAGDEAHWERRFLERGPGNARGGFGIEKRDFVKNPHIDPVPFSDGRFPTRSGKLELPQEIDLETIPLPEPTSEFPYHLLTPKAKTHHLSQVIRRREVEIYEIRVNSNSTPAPPPEGSAVRVVSKSGSIEAIVRFDPELPANVAVLPLSGSVERGNCANLLTGGVPDTGDPACPAFYSCFVRLRGHP